MGYNRGRNSGSTGLCDCELANGVKFVAKLYGFRRELEATVENFPGRGDDDFGAFVEQAVRALVELSQDDFQMLGLDEAPLQIER